MCAPQSRLIVCEPSSVQQSLQVHCSQQQRGDVPLQHAICARQRFVHALHAGSLHSHRHSLTGEIKIKRPLFLRTSAMVGTVGSGPPLHCHQAPRGWHPGHALH